MARERGSVVPLVALVVAVAAGAVMVGGRLGAAAVARAEAQTAADAAALAGAAEGEAAAREVAGANGARLVGFEELGADVRVRVERAPAVASARATRTWLPSASPPGATGPGVGPGSRRRR